MMWADWKGPIGHTATGLLAGGLMAWAIVQSDPIVVAVGITVSALVQVRQGLSWLNKRDKVGKDLQEHLQAVVVAIVVVLVALALL